MVKLVKDRRDTVWAFILKNAYRPAYIRRAKVDVIVGNPPWLSFRDISDRSYKNRIRTLTFTYKLLGEKEQKLATQMDTSTLFYVYCRQELLKEDGKIAFVMPKGVILPTKQHLGFQRYGLSRIHDMSKVTVTGAVNQHFFNVKSCVTVSDGKVARKAIPMKVWKGVLPKKNLPLAAARPLLSADQQQHDFLDPSVGRSPYNNRAFQGATLNPHTLWMVDVDNSVPLNSSRPMLKTSEEAYKNCKEKKWKLRVKGAVEKEFLFATALSEDILPFCIRRLKLAVLPVWAHAGRYAMVTHEEILGEGFEHASDWVKRAERIFEKNSKDKDMSAQDRLNYQKLLTVQNPAAAYVVLYNKSGTNISAACLSTDECKKIGSLKIRGFVAESVTYRIYAESEDEAFYLVAVLNSTIVNDAIKPYQTEGVYHGKRDIHRRPFEVCPIPIFDRSNPTHMALAKQARAATAAMATLGPKMEGALAKVRERARQIVANQIRETDALVTTLLGDFQGTGSESEKKKAHTQDVMF